MKMSVSPAGGVAAVFSWLLLMTILATAFGFWVWWNVFANPG